MNLSDLIPQEAIISSLAVTSKKQVLQNLAEHAAKQLGINERDIFETLLQRERLGSTGIGKGVAIPHGRLNELQKMYCCFAKLKNPIDYESLDDEPVDLIFLLLAPESAGADHLKSLARISRLVAAPSVLEKLRGAKDEAAIFTVLTKNESSFVAA